MVVFSFCIVTRLPATAMLLKLSLQQQCYWWYHRETLLLKGPVYKTSWCLSLIPDWRFGMEVDPTHDPKASVPDERSLNGERSDGFSKSLYPAVMCFLLPLGLKTAQNQGFLGQIGILFALDIRQAASRSHVANTVFAAAAPMVQQQGDVRREGMKVVCFCFIYKIWVLPPPPAPPNKSTVTYRTLQSRFTI